MGRFPRRVVKRWLVVESKSVANRVSKLLDYNQATNKEQQR